MLSTAEAGRERKHETGGGTWVWCNGRGHFGRRNTNDWPLGGFRAHMNNRLPSTYSQSSKAEREEGACVAVVADLLIPGCSWFEAPGML